MDPSINMVMALVARRILCHAWIAIAMFLCLVGNAEPPTIAVDSIFPPVLSVGTPAQVKITSGRFTQDVDRLEFSHPGITATVDSAPALALDDQPQKAYGTFQVRVASDVPEGFYEVWASGRYGISNSKRIAVIRAPVVIVRTDEATVAKPFELQDHVCYVGTFRRGDRQVMNLPSNLNNATVALVSTTLDSAAIPAMSVKTEAGIELLSARSFNDAPSVADFSEISSPANEAISRGEMIRIHINDFLFRGGDPFSYALILNPEATNPLLKLNDFAKPASVVRSSLPVWPNLDLTQSDQLEPDVVVPPIEIHGNAYTTMFHRGIHWEPKANESYECEVIASAEHQPVDLRAVVERVVNEAEGDTEKTKLFDLHKRLIQKRDSAVLFELNELKRQMHRKGNAVIATAEDSPSAGTKAISLASSDPLLTIPPQPTDKPGQLRLSLNNLNNAPIKNFQWTVRIGSLVPRFFAVASWPTPTNTVIQSKTTGSFLMRGGQIAIHVSARRAGGFVGPIEVQITNLPPGVRCRPSLIGKGQTETELILEAEENAPAWIGSLDMVATALVGDQTITQPVYAATIAISANAERGLPVARTTSKLWLSVSDRDVSPIIVHTGEGEPLQVARGASIKLPIRAVRRAGGEAKCTLRPQNLPSKVTLGEFELPANGLEASPELKVAADAEKGETTIWLQGDMNWKLPLHPESHTVAIAYRDRLQARFDNPAQAGDRAQIEAALNEAKKRVDQLAKDTAPRDFQTFFSTASFRLQIIDPPDQAK